MVGQTVHAERIAHAAMVRIEQSTGYDQSSHQADVEKSRNGRAQLEEQPHHNDMEEGLAAGGIESE